MEPEKKDQTIKQLQAKARDLRKKLTPNQAIFCDEYLKDRNGTRSYFVAYPKCKSDKAAASNAVRTIRKDKVERYLDIKLAILQDKADITVENMLRIESTLCNSDLRKLYDGEGILVAPHELPDDIALAVSSVKVKRTTYGKGKDRETVTTYEYKLWDKGSALGRMERHLGMNKDEIIVTGLEELGKRLNQAHKRENGE